MYVLEGKYLSLRLLFFVQQLERSNVVRFNSFFPKAQSALVYFMYDRSFEKQKHYKLFIKFASETFLCRPYF